jgi:hypothetical protein
MEGKGWDLRGILRKPFYRGSSSYRLRCIGRPFRQLAGTGVVQRLRRVRLKALPSASSDSGAGAYSIPNIRKGIKHDSTKLVGDTPMVSELQHTAYDNSCSSWFQKWGALQNAFCNNLEASPFKVGMLLSGVPEQGQHAVLRQDCLQTGVYGALQQV